jgi:hypothetical protein
MLRFVDRDTSSNSGILHQQVQSQPLPPILQQLERQQDLVAEGKGKRRVTDG